MSELLRTVTRVGAMKGERGYRSTSPTDEELDANIQVARDLLRPTKLDFDQEVLPMSIVVANQAYETLEKLAASEDGTLSLRRVSELIGSAWADGVIIGSVHEEADYGA